MKIKAENKAKELITAFGWKYARMVCLEMNIEHFTFPNQERSMFWKFVTKKVKELSE